jgi:archaellum component FlaC
MDEDLRLHMKSLEEELQSLRGQVAELETTISGVGSKSNTSMSVRLEQAVNLLAELRDQLKRGGAIEVALTLLLVVVAVHVWHHW